MNETMYPTTDSNTALPKESISTSYPVRESELVRRILGDFTGFGLISLCYGILYCFCLFQNSAGITSPLWAVATFLYYLYALRRFELPVGKNTVFYGVAILLLGISNCLTASSCLHFFNYTAIVALQLLFLIQHFYVQKEWNVFHYLGILVDTFVGAIGCLNGFTISFSRFRKEQGDGEKNQVIGSILLGLCVSVPLLFFAGFLLTSADAIFSSIIVDSFLAKIIVPQNLVQMILMLVGGTLFPFGIFLNLAKHGFTDVAKPAKQGEPLVAITFCSTLTILYVSFCFIQIRYLFFGFGSLSLPEGYTYAGYARQGFFQLLFVSILNLGLVLFCLHCYKENMVLKGILTAISLCTFIMIASSALRMLLYIETYQLTFLRVLVLWALLVIFLLMCGVIVYTFKPTFALFQYGLVIVTCFYIALSLSRPDTYIAEFNLSHAKGREDVYLDVAYLYDLSADAAPIIKKYGYFEEETLQNISTNNALVEDDSFYRDTNHEPRSAADLMEDANQYCKLRVYDPYREMGIRSFNFSIYRAGKALE